MIAHKEDNFESMADYRAIIHLLDIIQVQGTVADFQAQGGQLLETPFIELALPFEDPRHGIYRACGNFEP
jgi:hypothetical protein